MFEPILMDFWHFLSEISWGGVGSRKTFSGWGNKTISGGWVAKHFWKMTWQNILGDGWPNILDSEVPKSFRGGVEKNSMSLVQFQHLCVTFLHIYACLPKESPVCNHRQLHHLWCNLRFLIFIYWKK